MLVTVIIPVSASHVRYLPQALTSVRLQTQAQALVVNDTESSLRLVKTAVLNSGGKKGAAYCRNLGLEQVETPFVMFLDADDMLLEGAVEATLRAYQLMPEANYIYGDAWTRTPSGDQYYTSDSYDRRLIFQRNLHNVTTLIPTATVKAVNGFDEVIRGWEDWDFNIRLAINGFCGAKIPTPLILYQLHTGQNRAFSATIAQELVTDVQTRYADYISGRSALMGCCGSNSAAKAAIDALLGPPTQGGNMPQSSDGTVLLEFLGQQTGTLPFRVGNNIYYAANTPREKFIRVAQVDAANLVARGVFRLVPEIISQSRRPPAPLNGDGITIPSVQTPPKGSAVSIPTAQVRDEFVMEDEPLSSVAQCANPQCRHIEMFHNGGACQALVGVKPCGCKQFVSAPAVTVKKIRPKRKAKATT